MNKPGHYNKFLALALMSGWLGGEDGWGGGHGRKRVNASEPKPKRKCLLKECEKEMNHGGFCCGEHSKEYDRLKKALRKSKKNQVL